MPIKTIEGVRYWIKGNRFGITPAGSVTSAQYFDFETGDKEAWEAELKERGLWEKYLESLEENEEI